MPLFESQKSRNARCFGAIQYAVHKGISEEFVNEPEELSFYHAVTAGGLHVARYGVEFMPALKKAWGKGGLEPGFSLTALFTLHMIFSLYRALRDKESPEEEKETVQVASTNVLAMFKADWLDSIVDFMNLHTQFNYECAWVEGKTPVKSSPQSRYIGDVYQNPLAYELTPEQLDSLMKKWAQQARAFMMLGITPSKARPGVISWGYWLTMDKALTACGEKPFIDWRLQTFPVEKHDDLRWLADRPSLVDLALNDLGAWLLMLGDAQEKMFQLFQEFRQLGLG